MLVMCMEVERVLGLASRNWAAFIEQPLTCPCFDFLVMSLSQSFISSRVVAVVCLALLCVHLLALLLGLVHAGVGVVAEAGDLFAEGVVLLWGVLPGALLPPAGSKEVQRFEVGVGGGDLVHCGGHFSQVLQVRQYGLGRYGATVLLLPLLSPAHLLLLLDVLIDLLPHLLGVGGSARVGGGCASRRRSGASCGSCPGSAWPSGGLL